MKLIVVYAVLYDHCHCDKIRNQKMAFNEMLNVKAALKVIFCRQVLIYLYGNSLFILVLRKIEQSKKILTGLKTAI